MTCCHLWHTCTVTDSYVIILPFRPYDWGQKDKIKSIWEDSRQHRGVRSLSFGSAKPVIGQLNQLMTRTLATLISTVSESSEGSTIIHRNGLRKSAMLSTRNPSLSMYLVSRTVSEGDRSWIEDPIYMGLPLTLDPKDG